jgi:hypothetical protein
MVVPADIVFDWSENPAPIPSSLPPITEAEFLAMFEGEDPENVLAAEAEEINDFRRRHGGVFDISPYEERMDDASAARWRQSVADHQGVMLRIVRAVLLLMNSRDNVATAPHIPSEKLQKARARSDKAPVLGYTNVSISLARQREMRAAGVSAIDHAGMRLHMVRRHMRLLPKGTLTWVRAHPRGNAGIGTVEQTRTIKP